MRTHVVARKTHKWLGLFIGLQVVVWSLSGRYMTVVHIDKIHGDHLVREVANPGIRRAPSRIRSRLPPVKVAGIRLA